MDIRKQNLTNTITTFEWGVEANTRIGFLAT